MNEPGQAPGQQRLPQSHPQGGALQKWARWYGIGRPTGIDLGYESSGTLPTPAWRDRFLAASVFNLRGSGDKDNDLVKRTRAALGA